MGMRIGEDTMHASWKGPLNPSGIGTLSDADGSRVLDNIGYSTVGIPGTHAGKTNPEELTAAAHAACFSMALAYVLAAENIEPQQIDVSASTVVEMDDGIPSLTESNLKVRAQIPGLSADDFTRIIDTTHEKFCVVGKALAGLKISIDAQLT